MKSVFTTNEEIKNYMLKTSGLTVEGMDVKCTLSFCNEGYGGDYDEKDPSDRPLLRLDVEHRTCSDMSNYDGYEVIDNGSYCTQISMLEPLEDIMEALSYIWRLYTLELQKSKSVKKLSERLSWLELGEILDEARAARKQN